MGKKNEVVELELEPAPVVDKYVRQFRELSWHKRDFLTLLENGLSTAEVPYAALIQVQMSITMLEKLTVKAHALVPEELRETLFSGSAGTDWDISKIV